MYTSVRVPASSANLGPGFDALGLALDIFLTCRFRASDTLRICASGRDAGEIPCDDTNLIWQTALAVAQDVTGPSTFVHRDERANVMLAGIALDAAGWRAAFAPLNVPAGSWYEIETAFCPPGGVQPTTRIILCPKPSSTHPRPSCGWLRNGRTAKPTG